MSGANTGTKCPFCDKVYSPKVLQHHVKVCEKRPSEKELEEKRILMEDQKKEAEHKRLAELEKAEEQKLLDAKELEDLREKVPGLEKKVEELTAEIKTVKTGLSEFEADVLSFDKMCDKTLAKVEECKKLKQLEKIEADVKTEIKVFYKAYGITPVRAGEVLEAIIVKRDTLDE